MLEEPKPSQHHTAGHLGQCPGVSCRKEGKKWLEAVASPGSRLCKGVGMERVKVRRGGFESFIQGRIERREQRRCVPLYFSALFWLPLMGSMTTRVPVQSWEPRRKGTSLGKCLT